MHHEPHNRAMWHENCPGRRFSSPMKPRGDGSWECGVCGAVGRVTAQPAAEQPDSVVVPRELFGLADKWLLDVTHSEQVPNEVSQQAAAAHFYVRALLAGGDKP